MQKHTFNDRYDGIGGSYVINPKTGKREPAALAPSSDTETETKEPEEVKNGLEK
ncbi:MAG: hypothetical protein PSU93_09315 [Methylobacter sp.]|uniref:Uncharacterized protein n=1 Tax=Candidatus Methylobacter titanis TaxID=3053457 RepID=A0AA43Q7V6_9GAMM|nr:hypothetical protein [Candidatus Methylobacter titanis]